MEHIKSINEFFSFKEDFQRGKQKAIGGLKNNY